MNPENTQLWVEYVKMELGFIEGLRRRWNVLGLDVDADPVESKCKERETAEAEDSELATEAGRKQIMSGAIVKSVMTNGVEGGYLVVPVDMTGYLIETFRSIAQGRTVPVLEGTDIRIPAPTHSAR